MRPVPWSYLSSWNCLACGECCRRYTVNVRFWEWLQIVKKYGVEVARPGLTEFYLKKRLNGRCVFQYKASGGRWLCGLQHMKPRVCKLWPFKVHRKPIHGRGGEALYLLDGKTYYVYVDPSCRGISWGRPSINLLTQVIPEFIQLASGGVDKQIHSTSSLYPFDLMLPPTPMILI